MNELLVSIIVVSWNSEQYVVNCIKSLQEQSYSNLEIILVDNASSDNSVSLVERNFSNVKIIKNEQNVGFAEGNNIGIKFAKGEFIGLLNPDAIADPNWVKILIDELNDENIAAASGKIFYLSDKLEKKSVFCTWPKINPFSAVPYNFNDDEPKSRVDYLSGAAMIVKKQVINKIGLMDPDYFLYFEETDWCARMICAGYDLLYVPNAIAWHKVSTSVDISQKAYYMERSRFRFALKNFDKSYLPSFFLIYFF